MWQALSQINQPSAISFLFFPVLMQNKNLGPKGIEVAYSEPNMSVHAPATQNQITLDDMFLGKRFHKLKKKHFLLNLFYLVCMCCNMHVKARTQITC